METFRLILFTTLWTAIWAAPLPKLSRGAELVAGLIPFAAFGLRVFGACFIGMPADDPVRMAVAPLVDWINGGWGVVPFQRVLDITVAIGLVWFAADSPGPSFVSGSSAEEDATCSQAGGALAQARTAAGARG